MLIGWEAIIPIKLENAAIDKNNGSIILAYLSNG